MEFKRYDGFVGSAPQKKVDKGLPICPFCGKYPHWLLNLTSGFVSKMTCMCEKCGGKLYTESTGISFSDDLRVVDIGTQNINNLALNGVYHIETLKNLRPPVLNNQLVSDNTKNSNQNDEHLINQPQTTSSSSYPITSTDSAIKSNNKKIVSIIVSIFSIIIFVSLMIWIFSPSSNTSNLYTPNDDYLQVSQSNMQVEELGGYYYVTITGQAKNTSSKTMDYVSITFTIYDINDNVIGNAIDNQATLGAGKVWVYSATGVSSTNKPTRYEITDITVLFY